MIFGLRLPIYKKQMINESTYAGKDSLGNYWYLNQLLQDWNGLLGGCHGYNNKIDFDMRRDTHKRIALEVCTPFSIVAERCGSYFSNGRFYVTDKDGNEGNSSVSKAIRQLLKKPNLLQSGKQFTKQIEICLKVFGYCPVFTLRATSKSTPISMMVIPPELFVQEATGKLWKQTNIDEVIKRTYIEWNGEQIELEYSDYFVIVDSEIYINGSEVNYRSITDSLTHPVNNWMKQIIGRGTLIQDGGPKGIIHNDDNTPEQNNALTKMEKEELNDAFKRKYGIVNKLFSIWVTQKKVGWIPLTFDVGQLKLHEEDKASFETIANSIGIDPSIFASDSKYSNKEESKRSAYQDLIIPDAENVTETLTNAICPDGLTIKLDYSHVACLQTDRKSEASTLKDISASLIDLKSNGLLNETEARIVLSNYIDINPDKKW